MQVLFLSKFSKCFISGYFINYIIFMRIKEYYYPEEEIEQQDSLTSKEIPWNSMIGTEANNIRKKILFDSDFESAHSDSKPSMISEVSTPPSSTIERCSIETNTDSNPCAVRIEDKSTQVSKDELCNSDCEDSSTTTTPDRSDSNNNYLLTRSGKRFYKDI